MENENISMFDVLIETHAGLDRQGPGSPEMIDKALSYLENVEAIEQVADLGCGTGGQTLYLAQKLNGSIVGVDQSPDFISKLNENAEKQNLQDRAIGIVASMEKLPFEKDEFDLIWSEGAIDSIGFETGLAHWYDFLKKRGYVVVSCPSWLGDEHPDEVEKFWSEAESGLDTIEYNISVMQKTGYDLVATFALPDECWTTNYFVPREASEKAFQEKYPGNKIVEEYIESSNYEAALYAKYKNYYGYVFYIGRKI